MVEVFFYLECIALHRRSPYWGRYITNPANLRFTNKYYSDWNPEFFKKKRPALGHMYWAAWKEYWSPMIIRK